MPKKSRSRKVRLGAIAGVLATATAAGLSIAGSAHADEPLVQVKVCATSPMKWITLEGFNQDHLYDVWKYEEKVGKGQCVETRTTTGQLWEKESGLIVGGDYDSGKPNDRVVDTCRVPADASGRITCTIP